MMMPKLAVGFIAVAFSLLAPRANAEVTRVDITSRADVGASDYEKIIGIAHFDFRDVAIAGD